MAVYTDNFNRADNASLGANWTDVIVSPGFFSGHKISSNRADCINTDESQMAVWTGGSVGDDQYSQADAALAPFTWGLVVRTTSGGTQGYLARAGANGTGVTLHVITTSGLGTPFATFGSGSMISAGQTMKFTAVGTTLSVYINGSLVGSTTDSTYQTGGSVGIYGKYAGSDAHDNWEGGDVTAPPAVPTYIFYRR